MITLDSIDDLPSTVPVLLADALKLSRTLDETADRHRDVNLEALVILYKDLDGKLDTVVTPAAQSETTRRLDEDLKDLLYNKSVQKTPGTHVGTGVFSEGMTLTEGVPVPDVEGEALVEQVNAMLADGRAVRLRSSFAVFSDGWRFNYERNLGKEKVTVTIYEPGEEWDGGELIEILQALDDKLSTRG